MPRGRCLYRNLLLALLVLASAGTRAAGAIGESLREAMEGRDHREPVAIIVYFVEQADLSSLRAMNAGERRAALPELLREHAARSQSSIKAYLHTRGISRFKTLWINNALAVTVPVELIDSMAGRPEVARIELDATVDLPSPINGRR